MFADGACIHKHARMASAAVIEVPSVMQPYQNGQHIAENRVKYI